MMTRTKTTTRSTKVTTKKLDLSPVEEQVVRMRYGLGAPDDLVLEQKAEGNAELQSQLRAMEERVLAAVGARNSAAKRKIVGALRRKS